MPLDSRTIPGGALRLSLSLCSSPGSQGTNDDLRNGLMRMCEPGQTVQLTVDRVQGDNGTQDVERGPRRLQLKVKLQATAAA